MPKINFNWNKKFLNDPMELLGGLIFHPIGLTPRQNFKSNLPTAQWGWDFFSVTDMVSTDQKNVFRLGILKTSKSRLTFG